jgi:signal transduction histidine kinase
MNATGRLILCLFVSLLAFAKGPTVELAGQETPPERPTAARVPGGVLVLTDDEISRPWTQEITLGFHDVFRDRAPDIPVYDEFLDSARFEQSDHAADFREWLRQKYRNSRIQLVVAPGMNAVDFLSRANGEPWPDTPVLYAEVGPLRIDASGIRHVSGLNFQNNLAAQLRTIRDLLPGTSSLAVVYGGSERERRQWAGYEQRLRQLDPSWRMIDLGGLPMEDVLRRVAELPDDAVVMNIGVQVDGAGRPFAPRAPCVLIAERSRRPLFSPPSHELGCGVVGGPLRDFANLGRTLAEYALKRLQAPLPPITDIPVENWTSLAFDARQLERFGIPESRLPAGSRIEFRAPSLWRDYRPQVLAGLAVAILQTLLIAGLLLERGRRHRLELEARQSLVAVAHLDRRAAMGELATSLAHELNQPLNAILQNAGVAQMMLADSERPASLTELREIISDIRKDNIRAGEVIKRMRGLLQKHELHVQQVDINELAADAASLVRPDAASRAVQLDLDLKEGLAPGLGDRVHLQQVLLNLLLNAVDAVSSLPSHRRKVLVRTTQEKDHVLVSVEDTGPGIAGDALAKVFEPFYTTKGEGMGLGLAIARSIIDAHDGRLEARNNASNGATFWFTVPAAPQRA